MQKKKVIHEELSFNMTPMIDVVFLILIFFMLMPQKKVEGRLEANNPSTGGGGEAIDKLKDMEFNIRIKSKNEGDKILSSLYFNQRLLGQFLSLNSKSIETIYNLPQDQKSKALAAEHTSDTKQFNPDHAPILLNLMRQMESASFGSFEGKKTPILIDADANVPFKIVIAIMNACTGAKFKNMRFIQPGKDIFTM
ncbi:MAG: biopolymer transporter ExbD [Planctomycetes bacterium]|nr:biopolymer transporter ExbD [Planctomycetota bacterium]